MNIVDPNRVRVMFYKRKSMILLELNNTAKRSYLKKITTSQFYCINSISSYLLFSQVQYWCRARVATNAFYATATEKEKRDCEIRLEWGGRHCSIFSKFSRKLQKKC